LQKNGFTLIELMIVIAIIAVIAAIAIPGLITSQRSANERSASTSLKTITSAEADFRANDRDGNRVNDFWTANVAGLYTMTSAMQAGNTDPAIKLIDIAIAAADSDGTVFPAGGENSLITTYTVVSTKASYWFTALISDLSSSAGEADYTINTGGTLDMGDVHNGSKFGMGAWPDSYNVGRYVYLVNENNSIFRRSLTGTIRPSTSNPPGKPAGEYSDWPTNANLKAYWAKLD
jgi:type IV pilus assembly protein PilE